MRLADFNTAVMMAAISLLVLADEYQDQMQYDIVKYFSNTIMTGVTSLYNESLFYHLEQDLNNAKLLLAALDNAISVIDIVENTATAYIGRPEQEGYQEGQLLESRYRTIISFCQINSSTIVVVDRGNYCLRLIDRSNLGQTNMLAGKCEHRGSSDNWQENTTTTDLRLEDPSSASFDNKTQSVFISDSRVIHRIDLYSNTVYTRVTSPLAIHGILMSRRETSLLAVIDHSLVELSLDDSSSQVRTLAGGAMAGDKAGTPNSTLLTQPKRIAELWPGVYLITDFANNRVKVVDYTQNRAVSLCSGSDGYLNGNTNDCQLLHPYALLVLNQFIYIGERGTYGGGLRLITHKGEMEMSVSRSDGVALLFVSGILLMGALLLVVVARWYALKLENDRQFTSLTETLRRTSNSSKKSSNESEPALKSEEKDQHTTEAITLAVTNNTEMTTTQQEIDTLAVERLADPFMRNSLLQLPDNSK